MTYWLGLPSMLIGIPATLIIIYAWCAFARAPKRWRSVMETLATKANMLKYQRQSYAVNLPDGGRGIVQPAQPFAYSYNTDERFSATPGDYWNLADDEPLLDSQGEPMVLVFESLRFIDADEYEQA